MHIYIYIHTHTCKIPDQLISTDEYYYRKLLHRTCVKVSKDVFISLNSSTRKHSMCNYEDISMHDQGIEKLKFNPSNFVLRINKIDYCNKILYRKQNNNHFNPFLTQNPKYFWPIIYQVHIYPFSVGSTTMLSSSLNLSLHLCKLFNSEIKLFPFGYMMYVVFHIHLN